MTVWREWELSEVWATNAVCPDCGETLIITHLISEAHDVDASDIHNGICHHCRKQYTVASDHGTLTPNLQASEQQDRIDALEIRVAKLEATVKKLLDSLDSQIARRPTAPTPRPEHEDNEAQDFRKKYGYLL